MASLSCDENVNAHLLGSFTVDELLGVLEERRVDMSLANADVSEDYSRLIYPCAERTGGTQPDCKYTVRVVQNDEGIFQAFSHGQHEHHEEAERKAEEVEDVKRELKISSISSTVAGVPNTKSASPVQRTDRNFEVKAESEMPSQSTFSYPSQTLSMYGNEKFREFMTELLAPAVPAMSCETCPATFNSVAMLCAHKKRHGANAMFKCPQCSYSANSWPATRKHVQLHGIDPEEFSPNTFQCGRCPAKFNTRYGLGKHSRLHGAKHPLACTECNYACIREITLQRHLAVHGMAQPVRSALRDNPRKAIIPCAKCPAKFKTEHGLRKHMRLHGSSGKFSCGLCDLRSVNSHTVERHRELHGLYVRGTRQRGRRRSANNSSPMVTANESTSQGRGHLEGAGPSTTTAMPTGTDDVDGVSAPPAEEFAYLYSLDSAVELDRVLTQQLFVLCHSTTSGGVWRGFYRCSYPKELKAACGYRLMVAKAAEGKYALHAHGKHSGQHYIYMRSVDSSNGVQGLLLDGGMQLKHGGNRRSVYKCTLRAGPGRHPCPYRLMTVFDHEKQKLYHYQQGEHLHD